MTAIDIQRVMDAIKQAITDERSRGDKLVIWPHDDPTKMRLGGDIDCESIGRAVFQILGLTEGPVTPRPEDMIVIEE